MAGQLQLLYYEAFMVLIIWWVGWVIRWSWYCILWSCSISCKYLY